MRIRNIKNADIKLTACEKYIETKEKLQELLNNSKNINVEIGMGKGDFISKMAQNSPNNIYIGIELCKPVLALAIKKMNRYEEENNIKLNNVYLMSFDAIKIAEYFNNKQVDNIYLNFSDPWPKSKHVKRRLTNELFLKEYIKVLKEDGCIKFKTDNIKLFEYSLVSLNNFGMKFEEIYLDLHKTDVPNVLTEYECKFCEKGPIYMLVCKLK